MIENERENGAGEGPKKVFLTRKTVPIFLLVVLFAISSLVSITKRLVGERERQEVPVAQIDSILRSEFPFLFPARDTVDTRFRVAPDTLIVND